MDKIEAHMIINFCTAFVETNKRIYEDTKIGFRYKQHIDKTVKRINDLSIAIDKYNTDERNYANRMINYQIHDYMRTLRDELLTLNEDVEYMRKKLSKLSINQKVYDNVIKCENDIHRLSKILNQ